MENFNGLLSLLLASIEFTIILNLVFRIEKNSVNIYSLILLFLLFLYQIVEFIICGFNLRTPYFAYLALLTVTFMPPLSLFISFQIYSKLKKLNSLIFLPAVFFSIYYLFLIDEFETTKCTIVFASYNYPLGFLYGVFYYIPILSTILFLGYKNYINKIDNKSHFSKILFWGYSLTFIPGYIVTRIVPGMLEAVESILCSFAFILFLFITNFTLKHRENNRK